MLLAWLIHKGLLRNAQEGLKDVKLVAEKKPIDFPERSYKTLREVMLGKIPDQTSIPEQSKDATLQICFDFKKKEEWSKDQSNQPRPGFKNMDKLPCMLAVKFLKFMTTNTFKNKLVFDVAKGRVSKKNLSEQDRLIGIYWKIKDPFIKEYDYGFHMRKKSELSGEAKNRLKSTLASMREIISAISRCALFELIK